MDGLGFVTDLDSSVVLKMDDDLKDMIENVPAGIYKKEARNLRDAIGPSKGRLTQEQHVQRLNFIVKWMPKLGWRSSTELRDQYLGQTAIIVGGGPSLETTYSDIRFKAATQRDKIKIFAPNKSHDWMINGEKAGKKKWKRYPLIPDFGVMLDPAEYVVTYQTPHPKVNYLLGSTLDYRVFTRFLKAESSVYVWLPVFDGSEIDEQIERYIHDSIDRHFVSGGSTVGLRTINLAASMGFSTIELHGFDSCYAPGSKTLYAYDKPVIVHSLADYVIKSKWSGEKLRVRSNSMMAKQVMEFADMLERIPNLVIDGKMRTIKLRIHGDGAIPWLAWKASEVMPDFVEHATPEKMRAKYGTCDAWDYVDDKPLNNRIAA